MSCFIGSAGEGSRQGVALQDQLVKGLDRVFVALHDQLVKGQDRMLLYMIS